MALTRKGLTIISNFKEKDEILKGVGYHQPMGDGKKTGVYKDTSENRKLGRVGQKYTKDPADEKKIIGYSNDQIQDLKNKAGNTLKEDLQRVVKESPDKVLVEIAQAELDKRDDRFVELERGEKLGTGEEKVEGTLENPNYQKELDEWKAKIEGQYPEAEFKEFNNKEDELEFIGYEVVPVPDWSPEGMTFGYMIKDGGEINQEYAFADVWVRGAPDKESLKIGKDIFDQWMKKEPNSVVTYDGDGSVDFNPSTSRDYGEGKNALPVIINDDGRWSLHEGFENKEELLEEKDGFITAQEEAAQIDDFVKEVRDGIGWIDGETLGEQLMTFVDESDISDDFVDAVKERMRKEGLLKEGIEVDIAIASEHGGSFPDYGRLGEVLLDITEDLSAGPPQMFAEDIQNIKLNEREEWDSDDRIALEWAKENPEEAYEAIHNHLKAEEQGNQAKLEKKEKMLNFIDILKENHDEHYSGAHDDIRNLIENLEAKLEEG